MSTYSHEHYVHAPQHAVLELMETFFRAQGCLFFDVVSLPEEWEARHAFISADITATYQASKDGFSRFSYVVSPTDADGWIILWSDHDDYAHPEPLLAFLSEQLQTTVLSEHNNDQIDYWRWALFEQGKEVTSYWYLGREDQRWYSWPDEPVPPGAMTVQEAFAALERTYYHLSLHGAVSVGWSKTSLPLEQFRFVIVMERRG
jgi:hypothetical protein